MGRRVDGGSPGRLRRTIRLADLARDLHATLPSTAAGATHGSDPTLDVARITLAASVEAGRGVMQTTAVHGVWCIALPRELGDSRIFFLLRDGAERLRT